VVVDPVEDLGVGAVLERGRSPCLAVGEVPPIPNGPVLTTSVGLRAGRGRWRVPRAGRSTDAPGPLGQASPPDSGY
jgi:hypothetical protein